jgi:hypothetical protein
VSSSPSPSPSPSSSSSSILISIHLTNFLLIFLSTEVLSALNDLKNAKGDRNKIIQAARKAGLAANNLVRQAKMVATGVVDPAAKRRLQNYMQEAADAVTNLTSAIKDVCVYFLFFLLGSLHISPPLYSKDRNEKRNNCESPKNYDHYYFYFLCFNFVAVGGFLGCSKSQR